MLRSQHTWTSGRSHSQGHHARVDSFQEASAKSNLKVVTLELGGKTPAVVFDDADLKAAVQGTFASIHLNSGQICMANSRVYVQDTIADKFVEEFKQAAQSAKIGNPLDGGYQPGPSSGQHPV